MKDYLREKAVILAVVTLLSVLPGCSIRITEYQNLGSGNFKKAGVFSADEFFRRSVTSAIKSELNGENPDAGFTTWEKYWQWSYENISRGSKTVWIYKDFSTPEEMVSYVKKLRRAENLPLYNN